MWIAYGFALQAMATIPTPIFCSSSDPCSCEGGGFELYAPLCAAAAASAAGGVNTSNVSNNISNVSNEMKLTEVENEYVSLFDFLGEDTTTVLVSVGVVIIIGVIFALVRLLMNLRRAHDEKAIAQKRASELRRVNLKIQDQLMLTQLNAKQVAIVEANSQDLDRQVPLVFKLNWRTVTFESRLGSGTFGDCYKGRCVSLCFVRPQTGINMRGKKGPKLISNERKRISPVLVTRRTQAGRHVAIKRMRSGLVDEEGFKAFRKEVVMLSKVDHINIVGFVGYCMDPFLLIVMDFVSGGTLADLVKKHETMGPPTMDILMKILIGSATGLAYLHATEPMPILHRDVKSENILLTGNFEPRIADLGEARFMAEDHAMTIVGTPGYTAPEVLRGEHYSTSADVFSFAIVMCELLTLRRPYADIMKNDQGEAILTWAQVTAMTQKKKGGLRPSLPDEMDEDMVRLIRECWSSNATLRPSFSVIIVRLGVIARLVLASTRSKGSPTFLSTLSGTKKEDALALCRDVHDLLVHYKPAEWNEKKAISIIDEVSLVALKSKQQRKPNPLLIRTRVLR